MSRLHSLLVLSITLSCGTLASAQAREDGLFNTGSQSKFRANFAPPNYGYSRFQPAVGDTGTTWDFAEACRESGGRRSSGQDWMNPSNFMTRDRYEPVHRSPRRDPARNDHHAPVDPRFRNRHDGGFGRSDQSFGLGLNGGVRLNSGLRSNGEFRSNGELRSRGEMRSNGGLRYPGVPRNDYGFTRTPLTRRPVLNWHTDLRQAAQTVRSNPRPMLVTVTADWCSHCRRMKNETFTDAGLIQHLNAAGYVPVRLDADANKELVQRIGVTSLPTTLIVSPNLKIEARLAGFRSAAQLTQSLRQYDRNAEVQSDIKIAAK